MSISVTVAYPKRIEVERGLTILVEGRFIDRDRIAAWYIAVAETGVSYQLSPDEHRSMEPEEYRGAHPWKLPMVGQVIGCHQWGDVTSISILPTDQRPYDYNQMATAVTLIAVPAFGRLIGQKHGWESVAIPTGEKLFDLLQSRPEAIRTQDVKSNLVTYFEKKRRFDVPYALRKIDETVVKLQQAERHLERLRAIDRLRLHLYDAPVSDGKLHMLIETCAESGLVVEAALTTIYSALDIFAHVVNNVYEIKRPKTQVDYQSVMGRKGADATASLLRDYPEDALTTYLQDQIDGWIQDVSDWRHYVVHYGCLPVMDIVNDGVATWLPDDETGDVTGALLDSGELPVTATRAVTEWVLDLWSLLDTSYRLISERVTRLSALSEAEWAVGTRPLSMLLVVKHPWLAILIKFLDYWRNGDGVPVERMRYMYYCLGRQWRVVWTQDEFEEYISQHVLVNYEIHQLRPGTKENASQSHDVLVSLMFQAGRREQIFTVSPESHKWLLQRTPSSTLPSDKARVRLDDVVRRQAEWPNDAIVTGSLVNLSDETLTEVEVHSFYMFQSSVPFIVGRLEPGQTHEFECVWKDAFLSPSRESPGPVLGVYITRDTYPLLIRTTYRLTTPQGSIWAEDVTHTSLPNL